MRQVIAALIMFIILGCVNPTYTEADYDWVSAEIDRPYTEVYRKLKASLRDCVVNYYVRLENDVYPDVHQAELLLNDRGTSGGTFGEILLQGTDKGTTKVRIGFRRRSVLEEGVFFNTSAEQRFAWLQLAQGADCEEIGNAGRG